MSILAKLESDLNEALKNRDNLRCSTLRLLLSVLHDAEIAKQQKLTDEDVLKEIRKEAKKRKEAIEAYTKAERPDAAQKEENELVILQSYLPQMLSEDEIRKSVTDTISILHANTPQDLGKVIGKIMQDLSGKAEGSVVSKIAKEELEKISSK